MIRLSSSIAVLMILAACQSVPETTRLSDCRATDDSEIDQKCDIEEIRDVRQDIQKVRKTAEKRS